MTHDQQARLREGKQRIREQLCDDRRPGPIHTRRNRTVNAEVPLLFVVLPLSHTEDFIYTEGLEGIVEHAVPTDRLRADVYLVDRGIVGQDLGENLASLVESRKEDYPTDYSFDPRLPKKKKIWYTAAMVLPFVPESVPIIGKPFSYVRRITTGAGAFMGLATSLPLPDDMLGGVILGALIGWTLPTIYGITALSFDMLSRRYHAHRLREHQQENREKRRLLGEIADALRYQEMPVRRLPIEGMESEHPLYGNVDGDYQPVRHPLIQRSIGALLEDETAFNQGSYEVRRYYRQKDRG